MGEDTPCGDVSSRLRTGLRVYLCPLLVALDERVDRRLVGTFLLAVETVLAFRDKMHGLLLSEMGGHLATPQHAPAGTKRLSNLLRCGGWDAELVTNFLWRTAEERRAQLSTAGEEALLVWDDSVLEKPESRKVEGLCPVRSSKAGRLLKVKPGYLRPPITRPIFVPGLRWLALLLLGPSGPPTVTAMQWFTTRGERATDLRTEEKALLSQCDSAWGRLVLHVFDRGFAGNPWLGEVLSRGLRFVVRWPKHYLLIDTQGQERKAWEIARGRKSLDKRLLEETCGPRKGQKHSVGILVLPVRHPQHPDDPDTSLSLVVVRQGQGKEPWYLLTNEPVVSIEDAWRITFAYVRRWQIECAFRYTKSELGMESPRLWTWERRLKLLMIVTLAYAFLLMLLAPAFTPLRLWLLRHGCHRNGKRGRETPAPLYRLRAALAWLWNAYPPSLCQTPG